MEDLDQVVKRIALSIAKHVPVEKTAEVGLITGQELQKPNTRRTKSSWGFTFNDYEDRAGLFTIGLLF